MMAHFVKILRIWYTYYFSSVNMQKMFQFFRGKAIVSVFSFILRILCKIFRIILTKICWHGDLFCFSHLRLLFYLPPYLIYISVANSFLLRPSQISMQQRPGSAVENLKGDLLLMFWVLLICRPSVSILSEDVESLGSNPGQLRLRGCRTL